MAIKIYSTPSCGYCNKAKTYFKANSITLHLISRKQRRWFGNPVKWVYL